MFRHAVRGVAWAALLGVAALVLVLSTWGERMPTEHEGAPDPIPFAVIGDSNSHSYQDTVSFPAGSRERGGALRAHTFQWTEVLDRLRGRELDLGPWVSWGLPGWVAQGREWLGLSGERSPRKQDYLYNFANSGASCRNLMDGPYKQVPHLVALMDQEPERWKRGVVVFRIGLNDWGGLLDEQATHPESPDLKAVIDRCASDIGEAIALIHASHPLTRIMVSGIANEADDPGNFGKFQTPAESANIRRALDDFNAALRRLTDGDPRFAFFDDMAWWQSRWGTRDAEGKLNYKTVSVGNFLQVTNGSGDEPTHLLLADDHYGLVFNTLWAQALIARMREAFGLPLTPLSDQEVERFIEPLVTAAPPIKAPGS